MLTRLLARDPGKCRAEVLLLAYSPLWIAAVVLAQVTRAFTRWDDTRFLLFGFGLALPPWLMTLLPGPRRYLLRALSFITLLAFLQNYFGAAFFFRSLGMEYHFSVRLLWNGTPLFLYPLTVAYFSTYFVLMQVAWRAAGRRVLVQALLSYAMAFGETYFMANDMLRGAFSYADKHRALVYGSFCYGTLFFITLPLFYRIDEDPDRPPVTLGRVVWDVLAANSLILVCYEVYGWLMGPARG